MSLQHIEQLLKPRSIAVIGASNQPTRTGYVVMRNLLQGRFDGPIMPVTPHHKAVNGVLAYRSIDELPEAPDLAIICTRASRVPAIILQLGRKGTRSAIVIAAGLDTLHTAQGTNLQQQMLEIAQQSGVRVLGPNCLGIIVPGLGLNASCSHTSATAGKIAFVSQSSGVFLTLLDWARRRRIGFSHFISLGDGVDVDFDDVLDYLGRDPKTQAILLYLDDIQDGRRFMSAARAASFNKPILVIKSGTNTEITAMTSRCDVSEIGDDAVYSAAFRRAGMLRVGDLRELMAAVETLAYGKPVTGEHLAILSNGNGTSAMAIDALLQRGGRLATLEPEIVEQLQTIVHSGGRAFNPVNMLGDALPEQYGKVLSVLLQSKRIDNLLIMHAPSGLSSPTAYAQEVIRTFENHTGRKPNLLVNWMGEDAAVKARQLFAEAGIASFRTPEGAIGAFMHMVEYRRNQKLLSETPDSVSDAIPHHPELAGVIISRALAEQRLHLNGQESAELLNAYGISTIPTKTAATVAEAVEQAEALGFPVALKIVAPDIPLKSDSGGVVLNLNSRQEVEDAANASLQRVQALFPDATFSGFTLQTMARRTGAHLLRIQVQTDPVFGPVIILGEAGPVWNIHRNAVVALPPLNMALSRYLVIQALAEGKIREQQWHSTLDRQALCILLTKISQIIVDHENVVGLTINPVLAMVNEMVVLDVSVDVAPLAATRALAIRPYPKELEEIFVLQDGREVLLRPIRPEDEGRHQAFDQALSRDDRYKRYFGEKPRFSHEQMARFTQIDYSREMAFIAVENAGAAAEEILGVVHAQRDPDNTEAEFAIAIRSDNKYLGLGYRLMQKMIDYCRDQNTLTLTGVTMLENGGMANLARKLGFTVKYLRDDGVIDMHMDLQARPPSEE
jgi:acetyltransferase